MKGQQGAAERVAAQLPPPLGMPVPAGRRCHQAGTLEFPISPGSLPQHLSSVLEQVPAKAGAAKTCETVIVRDED
jgi:hypothetical protein